MIEFAGPLDRKRLVELLTKRGVDPASYSVLGGHRSVRYVLEQRGCLDKLPVIATPC